MAVELADVGFPKMDGANLAKRFHRYRDMYLKALTLKNSEGGGLSKEEILCGITLGQKLDTMCPHFDRMHAICGERANIQPPTFIAMTLGLPGCGITECTYEVEDAEDSENEGAEFDQEPDPPTRLMADATEAEQRPTRFVDVGTTPGLPTNTQKSRPPPASENEMAEFGQGPAPLTRLMTAPETTEQCSTGSKDVRTTPGPPTNTEDSRPTLDGQNEGAQFKQDRLPLTRLMAAPDAPEAEQCPTGCKDVRTTPSLPTNLLVPRPTPIGIPGMNLTAFQVQAPRRSNFSSIATSKRSFADMYAGHQVENPIFKLEMTTRKYQWKTDELEDRRKARVHETRVERFKAAQALKRLKMDQQHELKRLEVDHEHVLKLLKMNYQHQNMLAQIAMRGQILIELIWSSRSTEEIE